MYGFCVDFALFLKNPSHFTMRALKSDRRPQLLIRVTAPPENKYRNTGETVKAVTFRMTARLLNSADFHSYTVLSCKYSHRGGLQRLGFGALMSAEAKRGKEKLR